MKVGEGDGWEAIDIGKIDELHTKKFRSIFPTTKGKFFVGDWMNVKTMDISINSLKPGYVNPYLHVHVAHEEVYIFLSGEGEMMLDDKVIKVKEGYVVKVEPHVKRAVRNPEGSGQNLVFICVRAEPPFTRTDREGAGPVWGVEGWSLDWLQSKAKEKD